MLSKVFKLSITIAGFTLLSLFSAGSVNAQSSCAGSMYTDLNNTNTYEYALNDSCTDMYININNYQSHVDRIIFDAHDFGSNYKMDIYYKDLNGSYYLLHSNIDISTYDDQNTCDERNNEPDYGENRCFEGHTYNIDRDTQLLLLKVYTQPGKTIRYHEYAYLKNIRVEGYSNYFPYPTYTPTPYPTSIHINPNLIVEDIQISPENPDYYQNVDITAIVKNSNGNTWAKGFYVRMYRNNTEIANTYYDEYLYNGSSFKWKVNNNFLDEGYNDIRVIVDTDDRIYESNENDNDRTETVYKGGHYYEPTPIPYPPYYPPQVLGDNIYIYINGNCNNVVILNDIYGNRYYGPIYAAACYGITNGYSDNSYRPSSYITREEFITMLVRAFPEAFTSSTNCGYFNDVDFGNVHWYNIHRARCSGILRGYNDNTYRPSNYISYGEAASVIYNLLNNYGYNYNNIQTAYNPYFVSNNSPHYNGIYYLSNMNPYSAYPAYDYYYSNSQNDGSYADRGWIANSLVNARYYTN